MRIPRLLILTILTSCALVDGYQDNQHAWYDKALTEDERAAIIENGFILKDWKIEGNGGNFKRGKLYIEQMSEDNKHYNFVEIGDWEEEFHSSTISGLIKRNTHYDDNGNILARKVWNKSKEATDYYLLENWSSNYRTINKDRLLVQRIQTYYGNGQLSEDFQLAVIDAEKKRSDRLKTKYKIDTAYHYDDSGELLDKKMHKLSDSMK